MTATSGPIGRTNGPKPSLRRKGLAGSILADRLATAVLWATGCFVLLILGGIIFDFASASWGVISPSFVLDGPSRTALGGIGPFLWNSVYVLVLAMVISVPLGLLGAIYMADYASQNRVTDAIRFAEEAISSVPSIVVGLFGMILFVQYFKVGQSALSGALALSMFNLPLMARLAEQALRAVPQDERSASLALGATKWQTIRHVVLPLAIPGVTTAIILTAGRAFGEAAVLIFTSGVSNLAAPYHYDFTNLDLTNPSSPWSPFHHATTLSTAIWSISTEGAEGNAFVSQILNGTAAILIATVLIFNLGARFLSRLLTRRLTAA